MPIRQYLNEFLPLLCRPIVRMSLRHSVRLGEILEAIKSVLVEEAQRELNRDGVAVSTSRISAMTGVHRKDVTKIIRQPQAVRQDKTVIARVIGQWQSDPRFSSTKGSPRILSVEGAKSDFVDLVKSVSEDLNPCTVLFVLERSGSVQRVKKGLKLIVNVFVPKGDIRAGLNLLSSDCDDIINAVEENLLGDATMPNLHIRTEYDNIPEEAIPEIRRKLIQEGTDFHAEIRNYLAKFDRDLGQARGRKKNSGNGRFRVMLGAFSRVEALKEDDVQDLR